MAEKNAAMIHPANPTSNLIAALVLEADAPVDDLVALADEAVGLALAVAVDLGGHEILLKVIVEAPGIGTVTDALEP